MQLLLTNDAMTTSLIRGGWEHFCFFQVFFYFILRHLRHKALIVNKPSILISYDKSNKFASFCVIELSYQINDYIYSPTN
jgi:hypothetical protein